MKLTFPLASDPGNKVAAEFGLVFTLPKRLQPIYSSFGIDVATANGDDSLTLPVPATYIVDQAGIIRRSFIEADYTRRLDPEDVLTTLKTLKP